MRKPSKKVVKTVVGSGEHIYAYCNVKTNQVLYSLTSHLQDVSLDQLPDIGANYKPPTIRPDLWKPLFSVTLPSPEQGRGLFGKLKEWRKLHELNWEPPSYLSNPYTEKQIAEMKEKLENRGGSKKETVFDVIKRQKKKMKQKIVMNQKANSIADLAAVLIEQEDQGNVMAEERRRYLKRKIKSDFTLVFKLAEDYEQGGLKKLNDELDMMRAILREGVEGVEGLNKDLQEAQRITRHRLKQMVYAHAVIQEATAFAQLSQAEREKEIDLWKALVEAEGSSKPVEKEELPKGTPLSAAAFAAMMHREYEQTWEQIAVASRAEGYRAIAQEVEAEVKAEAQAAVEAEAEAEAKAESQAKAQAAFAEITPLDRQRQIDHWRTVVQIEEHFKPDEQDEFPERGFWKEAAFAAKMRREFDMTWEQVAGACRAEGYHLPNPKQKPQSKPESKPVGEETSTTEAVQPGQQETKLESRPASEETSAAEAVQPGQQVQKPEEEKIDYKTIIPCFPSELDSDKLLPRALPKRAAKHAAVRRNQPIFTTKGVKVEWANFLDAEFAKAWPEAVEHQPMGGNREKYETVRAEKLEKRSKYQLELAEMVELKRKEMGLSQNESKEEEEDVLEDVDEEAPREKTLEESAAEIVAAEELEAKEAAARQSAIQTLRAIRRKQRLPPQLEGIQSEILARVQAASAPRRQVLSKPTDQRPEATPAQ
ncbi:hypothetical protein PRZ48_003346 [Zasmidium cellare]|uniref:Large ribosomal subunit protein mL67 n=1 Tax=Zasmidium cellare TaxID=395010 RepID=A0ABR0EW33_ZASCE|nr:hypothetical protein PRZ48_003346 [Zasmidium cellare]